MAIQYYGNVQVGGTITIPFSTNNGDGASVTATSTSDVRVYKGSSTTETTSGITTSVDFDSVTGVHMIEVDTSSNGTFYTEGDIFHVVVVDWTVAGETVSHNVGSFSIGQIVGVSSSAADNADVVSLVNRALNLIGEESIDSISDSNKRAEAANLVYVPARDSVLEMHNWKDARTYATLTQDNTWTLSAASWSSDVATLTAVGHDIEVGDSVTVSDVVSDGSDTDAYNGTYTVTAVTSTTFSYALTTDPGSGTTFGTVLNPLNPTAWEFDKQFSLPSDMIRLTRIENETVKYKISNGKFLTTDSPVKIEYTKRLTTVSEMDPMLREAIAAKLAHEMSYRLDTSSNKQRDMLLILENAVSMARNIDSAQGYADETIDTVTWLDARRNNAVILPTISTS